MTFPTFTGAARRCSPRLVATRAPSALAPSLLVLTALALPAHTPPARAQSTPPQLPEIVVRETRDRSSLTVPDTESARRALEQVPGGTALIPDAAYRATPALTIKDVFDYTPGVWAQPKWGDDSRLSIRGAGLARNFHLRGIALYQDGVPLNGSDGSGDFQEIDATAFRYVEVFKGANALRYGAMALGGAINFVTPTGRDADRAALRIDAGSFGFWRVQGSAGAAIGPFDYFITGSVLRQNGFRDHSGGSSQRARANFGWQFGADAETRFYVDLNRIRQDIPGAVSRNGALTAPRVAAAVNLVNDYERNIDSVRIANKTTLRFDGTVVEFGGFSITKRLLHPIFQFIDTHYRDYGAFLRVTDERKLFGHDNRLTVGVNYFGGREDAARFMNLGGQKGALTFNAVERSSNITVYAENAFSIVPSVALVGGLQYVAATRRRKDLFLADGDQSGRRGYSALSPKFGVLWTVDPGWQVFGNISRNAEIPTFTDLNFGVAALSDTKVQRAWTFEIGTRGRREDYTWDVAYYRAWIRNELQFFDLGGGNYQVVNADRTIHQGVEAGFGAAILKGIFQRTGAPDRLWLNVAYTFSDFRFDGDPAWRDNRVPGAPMHYLRGEILYRHASGVFAGPNIEWVPQSYFVDNANTLKTRAYALIGFKAGYDDGGRIAAYIELRNLANTKYIASASITGRAAANQALFEPGTGRAVYAGVRVKW